MASMYDKMRDTALKYPDRDAVVFYGKRYSYGEMLSLTERAAAVLAGYGVEKGSTVTLCLPNTPSAFVAFYAVNRLGARVNLLHPLSTAQQISDSVRASSSMLSICGDVALHNGETPDFGVPALMSRSDYFMGAAAKLYYRISGKHVKSNLPCLEKLLKKEIATPAATFGEDETAVMLPSGGTTGAPKIIKHSNAAFNGLTACANFFLRGSISEYRSMYSVLPIFHGFGLCMNLHMCAVWGLTNVMCIKFKADAMARAIEKEKINIITGVPAMFHKLLASDKFASADLSSLKDCFVGGDAAPADLIEKFNAALRLGGSSAELYEGYGLTETVTVCTVNTPSRHKPGSIGVPLPETEVLIVKDDEEVADGEVGEICIRTPLLMLGYHNTEFTPIRDFRGKQTLFTGDYGYKDADGFLFFKQRIKNMIKVNGVPVFPSEIEEAAMKVDGVEKAAAIGVPDEKTGETAYLFIESGAEDTAELEERVKLAMQSLIVYARPKKIIIKKALPLNAIGKIDRKRLLEK